jgi:riboflavin synthase
MFTGIVAARGSVQEIVARGNDMRLRINSGALDLGRCATGDSIAVAGVCLTMLDLDRHDFSADVSAETLALTTLGSLQAGSAVNLELALALQDRLGGHLVSGHVDGLGRLLDRKPDGRSQRFEFQVPARLVRYIAVKGSITIDGVSLTINSVQDNCFSVNLIPHTLEVTSLGALLPGQQVNIEVDLLARYLERLLAAGIEPSAANVNWSES